MRRFLVSVCALVLLVAAGPLRAEDTVGAASPPEHAAPQQSPRSAAIEKAREEYLKLSPEERQRLSDQLQEQFDQQRQLGQLIEKNRRERTQQQLFVRLATTVMLGAAVIMIARARRRQKAQEGAQGTESSGT